MLLIHTATEAYCFNPTQVISIEADGNYSNVRLADGNEYLVSYQLGQIESILREQLAHTEYTFVRVGKSLIINLNEVRHINVTRQSLEMNSIEGDKLIFSASREALKKLMHLLIESQKKSSIRTITHFNTPTSATRSSTGILHGHQSLTISDTDIRVVR
ncbi:MAG: LytTR family transcriptional regulator [Bacteroidaceae bacterium]|nr:LytTR family transcriptional regulator [Bacteroidaceae bacterium]